MTTEKDGKTTRKATDKRKGSERREIDENELLLAMKADSERGFNFEGCGHAGTPRYG